MTWHDLPDGGGVLRLDESASLGMPLELEVVVDQEEGLAWGLWWMGEWELLAVVPLAEA